MAFWASLVSAITAWEKSAKLLEQLMEAYLLWRAQNIRSRYEQLNEGRAALVDEINRARAARNSVQLRKLNKLLFALEYNLSLPDTENQPAKG
jgi:hypothetical protein